MLKSRTLGNTTRSRTALAAVAATFLIGGTATEASAKSRHHHQYARHHHHHRTHYARASVRGVPGASVQEAKAAAAPSSASGQTFSGIASFYGNESGSQTASGQRFSQNEMTAAHRSLPFGTKLKVTHDGRSVVVTVNDRGPYVRGRVLDLSTGAARAIGLTASGIGRVTAEVVS
jgi:rare lipoprotein A